MEPDLEAQRLAPLPARKNRLLLELGLVQGHPPTSPTPVPPAPRCHYALPGTAIACRGDGLLQDTTSGAADPADDSAPCPCCNTLAFLRAAQAEAESCDEWHNGDEQGTGVTLWLNALALADSANPEATEAALSTLGEVAARLPDPEAPSGTRHQTFRYD